MEEAQYPDSKVSSYNTNNVQMLTHSRLNPGREKATFIGLKEEELVKILENNHIRR